MRQSLLDLVKKSIIYKYDLPYSQGSIERTIFSTIDDKCYEAPNDRAIVEIIYNSVIDYAFSEFELSDRDLEDLHTIAFQDRIRFDPDASDSTKLKYGFFGEVVLHAILKVFYGTNTIISKGYFYNPLENSESKGYDAYHLIDDGQGLKLWFGETKFHKSYSQAVNDVLSKINNSLSDTYLSKNLLALRKNREKIEPLTSKIHDILEQWDQNPRIKVMEELVAHGIELIYPVVILFELNKTGYDASIKAIPEYIKANHKLTPFNLSIKHSIFFILLPLENVKNVKTEVLQWIDLKKPLMS
jgi:hypothetical protein